MSINFNKSQRRLIKHILAPFQKRAKVDLYQVFVAIAYLVYTGCQWKMLPSYFPRPTTVYYHFRKWSENGKPIRVLKFLVVARRKSMGLKAAPTVAVVDSQSVRSGYAQSQKGVDGYKKVKGIKRQILVDSNGFPLLSEAVTANTSDSKSMGKILADIHSDYRTIALVKADMGYRGADADSSGLTIECVKSNFGTSQFKPISGRWVVERTNSWLENFRRLSRNYERYLATARAMTYIACILFMLRYI